MASKSIGNLYVSLGLATTPFLKSVDDAKRGLKDLGDSAKSTGSGIGSLQGGFDAAKGGIDGLKDGVGQLTGAFTGLAPAIASVTAILGGGAMFAGSVSAFLNQASSVKQLSNTFGMTAESASVLNTQLRITGIATEDYTSMAFKLDKQLKTNEAGLNGLGVATRDQNGNLLDQQTLLKNAASTMMEYKAGTDRNEVAMKLFGRSAQDAFALLKLNETTQARAIELTDALGLTLDKTALVAAKNYKEAMNEVKVVGEAVFEHIGQSLTPALESVARQLVAIAVKNMPSIISAIDSFGTSVKNNEGYIVSAFTNIGKAVAGITSALGTVSKWAMDNPGWSGAILGGLVGATMGGGIGALTGVVAGAVAGAGYTFSDSYTNQYKSSVLSLPEGKTTNFGAIDNSSSQSVMFGAGGAGSSQNSLYNLVKAGGGGQLDFSKDLKETQGAIDSVNEAAKKGTKTLGYLKDAHEKTAKAASTGADALVTSWNAAFDAASKAMSKQDIRDQITPTVTEAKDAVDAYRKSIEELQQAGDPKNTEALKTATEGYTASLGVLSKVQSEYKKDQSESEKLDIESQKFLGTYIDDTLSMSDALLGVKSAQERVNSAKALGEAGSVQLSSALEVEKYAHENVKKSLEQQKNALQQFNDVLSTYGEAAGLSSSVTSALEAQFKLLNKTGQATEDTFLKLSSTLSVIGTTLGGTVGAAITKIGQGLTAVNQSQITMSADGKTGTTSSGQTLSGASLVSAQNASQLQTAIGYASVANGVGQMIGGKTGGAISSGASSAATGAAIGSIIPGIGTVAGAIVGGIGGLVSSIFGGGGKSEAQNQSDATSVASSVKSLADSSGNTTAKYLMQLAGYNTTTLANLDSRTITGTNLSSSLLNRGYKSDYSLIKVDSAGKGTELTDQLTYLGKIEASIKKFANASVVQTLSDIDYKYAEIEAKIGATADTAKAKIDEIFTSVLGLSADTVGTAVASAFSSYSGYSSAGEKAATTISDSLITSIQNMGLSTTISDIIMPLYEEALTPYLTKITSGIKLTVADYSEISSVISSLKSSTTETVNSIYDLYTESGLLTSSQKSTAAATSSLTTATTELGTAATSSATSLATLQASVTTAQTTLDSALTTQSDYLAAQADATAQANVTALQAQSSAASSALTDAKTAVTSALSDLQSVVNAQKTALTDTYNAQVALIKAQETSQNAIISSLSSISDTLHSSLLGFSIDGSTAITRRTAQTDLSSIIAGAQSGIAVDPTKLSAVLSALNQPSQQYFSNQTDYAKDFYKTVSQVQALSTVTDTQLTTAQKQLSILEQQLKVLQDTYTVDTNSLDATYNVAVQQVNATYGVNNSVLSVAQGVAGVQTALGTYASATITAAATQAAATKAADVLNAQTAAANLAAVNAQLAANAKAVVDAQNSLTAAIKAVSDLTTGQGTTAGKAYQTFFARAGDTSGINFWNNDISNEGVAKSMVAFTNSPEFMNKISAATDPLEALYQAILMRPSDTTGKAFFQNALNTGETLTQIKNDLLSSSEYAAIRSVRGYDSGGVFLAGETAPELIHTSGNARIYNGGETRKMLNFDALLESNERLREEVKSLKEEIKAGQYAIAVSSAKSAKWIEYWQKQGMPPVRAEI